MQTGDDEVRRRISLVIRERIPLCRRTASRFSNRLQVHLDERSGCINVSVPGEYTAALTLLAHGLREPWAVVSVHIESEPEFQKAAVSGVEDVKEADQRTRSAALAAKECSCGPRF